MDFDFEMIKGVYEKLPERIAAARKVIGRPLTLTEKILYSHLSGSPVHPISDSNETEKRRNGEMVKEEFKRGLSYVDFSPDRVAMQDATAQMALLQFMQAGRPRVAVPSTVHCDHLIQAKAGAKEDLNTA